MDHHIIREYDDEVYYYSTVLIPNTHIHTRIRWFADRRTWQKYTRKISFRCCKEDIIHRVYKLLLYLSGRQLLHHHHPILVCPPHKARIVAEAFLCHVTLIHHTLSDGCAAIFLSLQNRLLPFHSIHPDEGAPLHAFLIKHLLPLAQTHTHENVLISHSFHIRPLNSDFRTIMRPQIISMALTPC